MFFNTVKPKIISIYIDENLEDLFIWWLVLNNPASLQQIIYNIQQKCNLYDEIKFRTISKNRFELYKNIFDVMKWYNGYSFYYKKYESKIKHSDYINFVNDVIKDNYCKWYFCNVFIDFFTTKKWEKFELDMTKTNKQIIFSLRENSKSNLLLQVTDLLLWWVVSSQKNIESELKNLIKKIFLSYLPFFKIKKIPTTPF